jgi:hypothetical protein
MPDYRLLVRLHPDSPMKSVSVSLNDRSEALLVAQRYDGIAELWEGDKSVCTINRAADGDFWIINNCK